MPNRPTNGAELLKAEGLLPDVVHTSVLRRAIHTAYLALDGCDRHWIPVKRSWRLNERHYGALQGKNKKQTLEQYGEEQFMLWRRSFDVPPPPIDDADEWSQVGDPRYAGGEARLEGGRGLRNFGALRAGLGGLEFPLCRKGHAEADDDLDRALFPRSLDQ